MARPKNPAHREALLAAATHTIAAQGLGASTASIAKAAGVSAGTLFVYFESKPVLINELFVALKAGMGRAASVGLDPQASPRDQLLLLWNNWIAWAVADPDRRRALAHLSVAEELTTESHQAVGEAYADMARLLDEIVQHGPLQGAPLPFVLTLLSAIADVTIDDLLHNPDASAGSRSALAFEAAWRALAG